CSGFGVRRRLDPFEKTSWRISQIGSTGRFARSSGARGLLLRLPRSAGYGLSDTSAADDFPSLWFDSLQLGNSDSGLDIPEGKTAKAFVGATPAGISDRALRFRCKHSARRLNRVAQPNIRTTSRG